MRELKFSFLSRSVRARGLVVCCILVVSCCELFIPAASGTVYAQAGRRVTKPKNDPPVPKADPTITPSKEPAPEPEKISLLVVSSRSSALRYAAGLDDNLPGVVVRRLSDSRRLQVASGGEMSRGEANKRARDNETKTFVVWFELEGQGFDLDPINRRTRVEDLSIRYIVLEPGTGKVKDQGSVNLRPVSGGVFGSIRRLPSCYPQVSSNLQFALTVAGIETAERIIRDFSLPNPPLCS